MVTRHSGRTVRPPTPESKTPIGRGSIGKEATLAPVLRRARGGAVRALAFTATANAATPQQLTLPMSDGTQLSCSLTLPDSGTATAGVMLFHGLGGKHQDMEPIATNFLVPAGYVALACDARGHGASGGQFGLDGPRDVQDTEELITWISQRIGTTNIVVFCFFF